MNYLSIILKYMNNVSMSLYRAHLNNIDNIEKNCHFIGFYMKICLTITIILIGEWGKVVKGKWFSALYSILFN